MEKDSFSALFLSPMHPNISEAPFPQPTTPPLPQFALLVQGHVLQPLSHKALHVKHAILCLAFLFGGASPNYRCKLGPSLAAVYICMGHPPCFLPCLFTDKFYGLSSIECALEPIRSAFVAACCAAWMYQTGVTLFTKEELKMRWVVTRLTIYGPNAFVFYEVGGGGKGTLQASEGSQQCCDSFSRMAGRGIGGK